MSVFLEIDVQRNSGPFQSNDAIAEALGELLQTSVDVEDSEYEVTSVIPYYPPNLPKWREWREEMSRVVDGKYAGHVTEVVWSLLKKRGLTPR